MAREPKRLAGRDPVTDITSLVRFPKTRNPSGTQNPREGTGKRGLRGFLERKKQLAEESVLERDLFFFGRFVDALRDPALLARGLCHRDATVRYHGARAAAVLAEKGFDVSGLLPQLAAGLSDSDRSVRYHCAWALGNAAKNGFDISKAVPALGKTLSNDGDPLARSAAAFALCVAGENGADLRSAREALMAASNDPDATVKRFASDALFHLQP